MDVNETWEVLSPEEELKVTRLMAKEFLEQRLYLPATEEYIELFTTHIMAFEAEIRKRLEFLEQQSTLNLDTSQLHQNSGK